MDVIGKITDREKLRASFLAKWLESYRQLGISEGNQIGTEKKDVPIIRDYADRLFTQFRLYTPKEFFDGWQRGILKYIERLDGDYPRWNYGILKNLLIEHVVYNRERVAVQIGAGDGMTEEQRRINAKYQNPSPDDLREIAENLYVAMKAGQHYILLGDHLERAYDLMWRAVDWQAVQRTATEKWKDKVSKLWNIKQGDPVKMRDKILKRHPLASVPSLALFWKMELIENYYAHQAQKKNL